MVLIRIKGDLLEMADQGHLDVIVHGCNCFHAMGGGIAAKIAARYPEAELADNSTVKGCRGKLGNFSHCLVEREGKQPFALVNAYTQYKWSGFEDVFEYEAFDTFLNRLCAFLARLYRGKDQKVRVGFPKIGCGLARGDEPRIVGMLEKFAKDVNEIAVVTVVEY